MTDRQLSSAYRTYCLTYIIRPEWTSEPPYMQLWPLSDLYAGALGTFHSRAECPPITMEQLKSVLDVQFPTEITEDELS